MSFDAFDVACKLGNLTLLFDNYDETKSLISILLSGEFDKEFNPYISWATKILRFLLCLFVNLLIISLGLGDGD